jgi:hypothetical protein
VLTPSELAGQRLLGVTASLHEHEGTVSQDPVHVWLCLETSGYIQCHTAGSGNLALLAQEPYAPYDMEEHGRVLLVENQPPALAAHTGEVIEAATALHQGPAGMDVGVLLTFESGSVAVANLGDELMVGDWPQAFNGLGVHSV